MCTVVKNYQHACMHSSYEIFFLLLISWHLVISLTILFLVLEAQKLDEVIQHNLLLGMKPNSGVKPNSVAAHGNMPWLTQVSDLSFV